MESSDEIKIIEKMLEDKTLSKKTIEALKRKKEILINKKEVLK